MSSKERVFLYAMLTFCAVMLTVIAVFAVQANTAQQQRLEQIQAINALMVDSVSEVNTILQTYQDTAYGNTEIDRIAEQQLLATETTNALLSKLTYQIGLLSQMAQ